jgi:hypothetical protein
VFGEVNVVASTFLMSSCCISGEGSGGVVEVFDMLLSAGNRSTEIVVEKESEDF